MDFQKREQFCVGLRKVKKAEILKLKRKLLFPEEFSNSVFAGNQQFTKIESETQLSYCLDSLLPMFENRDEAIFERLNALQELSEETNYQNPRHLVFKFYSEEKSYKVLF